MNKLTITLLILAFTATIQAQSLELFMESVGENHPGLVSLRKQLESAEALARTGNLSEDPEIAAGWFPGNSEAPGTKFTWGISQSFDFPTRYIHMRNLKKVNLDAAGIEYYHEGFMKLGEARETALELLNLRSKLEISEERHERAVRLSGTYSQMLENGSATAIEFNRIKLNEVQSHERLSSIRARIDELTAILDYMSGGNLDKLDGALLPSASGVSFDTLAEELESKHPSFILPFKVAASSEQEVALVKSESLPSFEIGYESEIVVDERFTGPSLAMSLPLWKNRGRIKQAEAEHEWIMSIAEEERMKLHSYYMSKCSSLNSAIERLKIIRDALAASDNRHLLDLSLSEGEISLAEYLVELSSLNEMEDIALDLELEIARLYSRLTELQFYSYL